jgi:hypothetical protein
VSRTKSAADRKREQADARYAEHEERQREILTLRHRLEFLEPAEAVAKAIRKRLRARDKS